MEIPTVSRLITTALSDIDATVAQDRGGRRADAWLGGNTPLEHVPDTLTIEIEDGHGQRITMDAAMAMATYGRGNGLAMPWRVAVDVSGAILDLENELGFSMGSLCHMTNTSFRMYLNTLKEMSNTVSHLYTYSRRLDSAYAWASAMPPSMREGEEKEASDVRVQLHSYLRQLGTGVALNDSLDAYGKCCARLTALRTLFVMLQTCVKPIVELESNVASRMQSLDVSSAPPVDRRGTIPPPPLAILRAAPLAPAPMQRPLYNDDDDNDDNDDTKDDDADGQIETDDDEDDGDGEIRTQLPTCLCCSDRQVSVALVACGHMCCESCFPASRMSDIGNPPLCPVCDRRIQYRLNLNYP